MRFRRLALVAILLIASVAQAAKFQIVRGSTSVVLHVFILDSTSTVGAGKTALAFGDFSCRYVRNGETISGAITAQTIAALGTYAAPTANTNIRIKLVDDTNMPGVYEVQLHNDWVNATNTCRSLIIFLSAAGAAPLPIEIELTGVNLQDGVRGGMTALPAAAADAAGGLPISDGGGLALDTILDAAISSRLAPAGTLANVTLCATVTTLTGHTPQTADHTAGIADIPTVAEFNARTILSAAYFDPANDAVARVTLVDTTTTNTDMRGTNLAALAATALSDADYTAARAAKLDWLTGDAFDRLGAPAGLSVSADIAAAKVDTAATLLLAGTTGVVTDAASRTASKADVSALALETTATKAARPVMRSTTIAAVNSQTSFTLTAGSTNDDDYNTQMIVLIDAGGAGENVARCTDYTGATKTVTLAVAPSFTIAPGDTVIILAYPAVIVSTGP